MTAGVDRAQKIGCPIFLNDRFNQERRYDGGKSQIECVRTVGRRDMTIAGAGSD